jgi:hypothetical protein
MRSNKNRKENQITEFVIRYTDKELEEYLIQKGFFGIKKGVYENLNSTHVIEVNEGIKFIYYSNGSIYGNSVSKGELSFIPEIPIIDYILRQINFIK